MQPGEVPAARALGVASYGDAAVFVRCREADVLRVAGIADAVARDGEVVLGIDSVVVRVEPGADLSALIDELTQELAVAPATTTNNVRRAAGRQSRPPRAHTIRVRYNGADLEPVAAALQLTGAEVVARHCAGTYEVAMLGFAPGFPYLRGLDPLLHLPRRATPRSAVPAGSVAIAGRWTAVYPNSSPGGWHLLGTTTQSLFDPGREDDPTLLLPGDTVRFAAIESAAEAGAPQSDVSDVWVVSDDSAAPERGRHDRRDGSVEVLAPGFTLIEDLGRPGFGRLGVSRSGAADIDSHRLANRLVGNDVGAASLECCLVGPTLRFHRRHVFAVVGATCDVPYGTAVEAAPGEIVNLGALRFGARAYLGVAGGFAEPMTLGSRSTDVLGRLGPRPLRTGDRLEIGTPSPALGLLRPRQAPTRRGRVRVLAGPGPGMSASGLLERTWRVTRDSDRIGLRLEPEGGAATARGSGDVPSFPLVRGAIQLPPDGNPIVLLADHGTTGGYPVIAVVASADLGVIAQARPGDHLRFELVDLDTARRAWIDQGRAITSAIARLDRFGLLA